MVVSKLLYNYGSVSRMSGWSRDWRFFKKRKALLTFPFNLLSSFILAFIFAFSDFLHQPSTRTWKAFDEAKINRLGDSSEYCICQTMIRFPASRSCNGSSLTARRKFDCKPFISRFNKCKGWKGKIPSFRSLKRALN